MRAGVKLFEMLLNQINETTGCDFSLSVQTLERKMYRVVCNGESCDVSPRLPAGEMEQWIRAFAKGIYEGTELHSNPFRRRFANDHNLGMNQVAKLCRLALKCKRWEEARISHDNPSYGKYADEACQEFEEYARSIGIVAIRWPGLLPQVSWQDGIGRDWYDLPLD